MWDVSLALHMRVRTNYYASAERFEIQGDKGVITVSRCSDRLLDEPVLTLYRDGEVRSWHNIEDDWGEGFRLSTRHFIDVLKKPRAPANPHRTRGTNYSPCSSGLRANGVW